MQPEKFEEKAYDELLNKDFYVNNLGWSEEVWDFEPLKEKKGSGFEKR